jgi:phospholipase/lecithinase/hemolysin
MNIASSRRDFLRLAGAGAAVALTGCGSGSVVSAIKPKRFYVLGDGFSDVGQNAGAVATVNDAEAVARGDKLTWIQELAGRHYGLEVTPAVAGGTGYAQFHARLNGPDTTSGHNAPSVQQQINKLLASGVVFEKDDLVFINGGMHDIVDAVSAGGISDATTAIVKEAGKTLGAQVRSLVAAGAQHVVVTGVYYLGISPWGRSRGPDFAPPTGLDENAPLNKLSNTFNAELLKDIEKFGATVLYLDAAQFYNFFASKPQDHGVSDAINPVCTSASVLECTTSTLVANANPDTYLFADDLHFTPAWQRAFVSENYVENAYTRLKYRW